MVQQLTKDIETSRYHTEVGLLDKTSHYGRLALLVGQNKQVLELGCSTGYFSNALSNQFGCTVTGVELDANAAQEAEKYCKRVIQGDLDKPELLSILPDNSFDVIVMSDVLEHLRDPHQLLMAIKRLLKPSGYLVASIPHVGHGSVRLSLLSGQFPYRRMGLLDDTHLRFFDRIELENLFHQSGYQLSEVNRNRWSMFDSEVGSRVGYIPQKVSDLLQTDPEADTYQFIVKAHLRKANEPVRLTDTSSVDFVIFETANQPLNDRLKNYLSQLELTGAKVKYHVVRSNGGALESYSHLPLEQFEFGNHDFRTFRYVHSGTMDQQQGQSNNTRALTQINKGQTLNTLKENFKSQYIFVTDTQHLPTTDCLPQLIEYANNNAQCGIVAATPEVYAFGAPYRSSTGNISWAPFQCVLIKRSVFENTTKINAKLSSPSQETDFCWQLGQKGIEIAQISSSQYFSYGISIEQKSKAQQAADAVQFRLLWKSARAALSFIKNNILNDPELSLFQKTTVLAKILSSCPSYLTNQQNISVPGKIGFYGPGSIYCGYPAPVEHDSDA